MIRNGIEMIVAMSFDFSPVHVEVKCLDDMIKCKPNRIVQRFFLFAYSEIFRI